MDSNRGFHRRPRTYGKKSTTRSYLNSNFQRTPPCQIRLGELEEVTLPGTPRKNQNDALKAAGAQTARAYDGSNKTMDTTDEGCQSANAVDALGDALEELALTAVEADIMSPALERPVLSPRSSNVLGKQPMPSLGCPAEVRPKSGFPKHIRFEATDSEDVAAAAIQLQGLSLREDDCRARRPQKDHGEVEKTVSPSKKRPTRKSRTRATSTANDCVDDRYAHIQPLLHLANDARDRRAPCNFQDWADGLDGLFDVEKIAEASYGEVYKLKLKDASTASTLGAASESVLKVIPLKPEIIPRSRKNQVEHMSPVEDVLVEARTLLRMSVIPGFTNLRDIRVMEGRFPTQFSQAWKKYLRDGAKSYFPDPSKPRSYTKAQLWAVVEMENAGMDLEKFPLRNTVQTWDVFWGVAMAMAKGEDLARFEHRDLHLGNICVRERGSQGTPKLSSQRSVGSSNLQITIIDYTLSRAEMEAEPEQEEDPDQAGEQQQTAYLDLEKDLALFAGEGEYQYDVYRYMRSALYYDDPLAEIKDDEDLPNDRGWHCYAPITNALWLHFILDALRKRLSEAAAAESTTEESGGEAGEGNETDTEKNKVYERRLAALEKALDPHQRRPASWWTARGVVDYALKRGWLHEQDVIECDLG
ncbi:MAG: hypothetical protein M1823_001044 [Watsoniomyces obsoletus]|nr:MAG: hypothetical protein M1823_001044 [Watsoniomyces obsoletus]